MWRSSCDTVTTKSVWQACGWSPASSRCHACRQGNREGRTYRIRQRASALVTAVTSFSNRPLVYIFYVGCCADRAVHGRRPFVAQRALFHSIDVPGYAS